jgi:uncharacterized protein (TIRG00374 family)
VNKSLRLWIGISISIGFILILFFQVNVDEIAAALGEADYVFVAPAIGLYFVAVYFRAVRWRYLLSPMRSFKIVRLYPVVIIGYMANNLLPIRLGELIRSYHLAQRERFSTGAAFATVIVERIYDGITLLAFAAIAGPLLFLLGQFDGTTAMSRTTGLVLASLSLVVFMGALAFLSLLVVVPGSRVIPDKILVLVPGHLRPKIREITATFMQGLGILNSPGKHIGLFLLSLPIWFLEVAIYVLVMYSFGIDGEFGSFALLLMVGLLLTATSNIATSVPASIGGIGPFEVAAQQTLVALGVGGSVAGAYAGFLHLVALWLPVNLVGIGLMWQQNLSWRQLMNLRLHSDESAVEDTGPVVRVKGVIR